MGQPFSQKHWANLLPAGKKKGLKLVSSFNPCEFIYVEGSTQDLSPGHLRLTHTCDFEEEFHDTAADNPVFGHPKITSNVVADHTANQ